jgi:hypothetical protein
LVLQGNRALALEFFPIHFRQGQLSDLGRDALQRYVGKSRSCGKISDADAADRRLPMILPSSSPFVFFVSFCKTCVDPRSSVGKIGVHSFGCGSAALRRRSYDRDCVHFETW